MFFPGTDRFVIQTYKRVIQKTYILAKKGRMLFPAERYQEQSDLEGIFQFISFHKFNDKKNVNRRKKLAVSSMIHFWQKGSLTLEMAIVLPLFLFAMLAILQFATVENASSALLAGAQDTAKEMAAYAYIQSMGTADKAGVSSELLKGGLSAGYARSQIRQKSGIGKDTGTFSLLQSRFTGSEILDLAGTFQPTHTWTILPVKKVKSIFRARVRAWTGRTGGGAGEGEDAEEETDEEEEEVYVTETGTVYHKDPDCTHIRLSIRSVSKNQLKGIRNVNGGKYHACERCRGGSGDKVYVSPYGDKYHSSLNCSGLKRTVNKVSLSEAEKLRPCSKCGK